MNKEVEYRQLVKDVEEAYRARPRDMNAKGVYLEWCEACEEINLWTYWQGRGNYDPKYLLVGQDWGCADDDNGKRFIENIQAMKRSEDVSYIGDKISWTDRNLVALFEHLGYPDIGSVRYEDLFFTNLCLGYRSEGISGNLKKNWLRQDYPFFRRLVQILEPQTIICLGRDTFVGVLEALCLKKPKIKRYNDFIESGSNPVRAQINGAEVRIFGFAHCGVMGTLNRNNKQGTDLEKQKQDWERAR